MFIADWLSGGESAAMEWQFGEFELWLNIKKTEFMECGPETNGTISTNGENLKLVEKFKYLGSLICRNGGSSPDPRACVNATCMEWCQVTGDNKDSHYKSFLCLKWDNLGSSSQFVLITTYYV